ncbi:uncharacterized protein LOC118438062 [Folsomia candida]|uniref:uncharacterized protein LOC118438062 n=1 Tax=Folsomia candida TaxID=158441 RepID=UPI001604FC5E|nr:uncharacterized protein LOC118438062 [Folsomia candida]
MEPATKPFSRSSLETNLISIISLGSRISQFIGYFPMSISKTNDGTKFTFSWATLPIFSSLAVLAFQIFLIAHYFSFGGKITTMYNLTRSTEQLAFNVTGVLICFQVMFKISVHLLNAKRMLSYWDSLVTDFNQISSSDISGNFVISLEPWAKHGQIFRSLRASVRHTVLGSLALIFTLIAHIFTMFCILHTFFKDKLPGGFTFQERATGMLAVVAWNIMGSLNVFQSIWITFPIQVMNACLEMIVTELSEFNESEKLRKGGGDLFLTRISPLLKEKNNSIVKVTKFLDEEKLHLCILNYHRVVQILRKHESVVGNGIAFEVGYNSLLILAYLFIGIIWAASGQFVTGLSRLIPIILCAKIMYHLGTEAGKLDSNRKAVLRVMCRMRKSWMSGDTKDAVFGMIHELSGDKLKFQAGEYFALNRRLLTSIFSAVLTFLVVLVQFRDGERK